METQGEVGARRGLWLRAGSRAHIYPLVGVLAGLGSPVGLALLRLGLADDVSLHGIVTEVAGDRLTYGYLVVSTALILASLGLALGRAADRLSSDAITDPLTGLHNRRKFRELLLAELARAARYRTPFSILLVDVDGLKQLNDVGGHQAGDAALMQVARALRETCRATDAAARWGGDEFMVLLPHADVEHAVTFARRARERLKSYSPGARAVTISIGITDVARAGGSDLQKLYAAADAALYRAKSEGRDREVVAEPPVEGRA